MGTVQFDEEQIALSYGYGYAGNKVNPHIPDKSLSTRDKVLIIIGILAVILTLYVII